MNFITLRASQTTLAYQDEGDGPVLVLLHAFPFDSAIWQEQRSALADAYRVLTPDFPGFGGSAASAGLTIDSAADIVAELLDHLGVNDRVVVGGLSMGGYVALAFARLYPQRLRALILADTKAEADNPAAREARNAMIVVATTEGAHGVIDRLLPKMVAPETRSNRPDVMAFIRDNAERQTVDGIVAALQALRDRPDATAGLAHISVPTLVLVGEDDEITPADQARTMAASIPDSRLFVLPRCGHLSSVEDPRAFTTLLRQFLDGLPSDVHPSRVV